MKEDNNKIQDAGKKMDVAEKILDIAAEKSGNAAKKIASGAIEGVASGAKKAIMPIILKILLGTVGLSALGIAAKIIFAPKPFTIDNTANVIEEIKKIGQFTSVCFYEEMVLSDNYLDTTKNLFGREQVNTNEIILIGKGRVRAGFDLAKVAEEDIIVQGDTIMMTLPQTEIFDIITNPSDYEVEYEQGTWNNENLKPVKARGKAELEQDAMNSNILEKAEENGLKRLEALFKTFGFNTVILTVVQQEAAETPEAVEADGTPEAVDTVETPEAPAAE